ncbi:MAG TPA: zinc-ribbon domain-containing protein [Pyrinomonadaceae bacterium]|nr:zinc-ribbon domain-containing protein [Pyrinomonadaceae bacterium]
MSTDYSSGTTVSDHDVTLAIPGDVESVRMRLSDALQTLGYRVLGEQPLYAKRSSRGCAAWDCSYNVLDYPTSVSISLKQTNNVAVVATFNYEIKSFMPMTKGDKQTLTREAEAIAALATERLAISACRACGTQVTDESHFCRRCGAPLVLDVPELEVLRLTRSTRGSYHNIFVGLSALLLSFLFILLFFVLPGPRIYWPLLWIAIPFATYAFMLIGQGSWQLHRTLNPKSTKTVVAGTQPVLPATAVTTALPPARPGMSVTEATTDLLSASDSRVAEPVERKDRTTAEMNAEGLM